MKILSFRSKKAPEDEPAPVGHTPISQEPSFNEPAFQEPTPGAPQQLDPRQLYPGQQVPGAGPGDDGAGQAHPQNAPLAYQAQAAAHPGAPHDGTPQDGAPPPLAGTVSETPDAHYSSHEPYPDEGWLTVQGVQKSYGKRMVVRDVSLAVGRGESIGLLGPNGAGKTTLFYMITGLVPADAGKIFIDGRDVTTLPMYRRARLGIGYLPQEASIFRGLTVEQNIMSVLELVEPNRKRRKEQLDSLLEEFRITERRHRPSIELSGGERRRCEIARALASRPHFMLLDEPFAGVDPIAVGDIQDLVRHLTRRGIGVLITDHNVRETLQLIDRAYIVFDGHILTQGNPEEIIANEDVRRVYLGDKFD